MNEEFDLFEYSDNELKERMEFLKKTFPNLSTRSKYYNIIIYEESVKKDFQKYLRSESIGYCLSPLHDKDVNEYGEIKKAHWHLILCYNSLKAFSQVFPVAAAIGGINVNISRTENIKGSFRYLIHADDMDKYQYSFEDLVQYGVDFSNHLVGDFNNNDFIEMFDYVRRNNILFLCDFLDFCKDEKIEWYFALLENHKYISILKDYMHSALYKKEKLLAMGKEERND